jgi:hypothetical protein
LELVLELVLAPVVSEAPMVSELELVLVSEAPVVSELEWVLVSELAQPAGKQRQQ